MGRRTMYLLAPELVVLLYKFAPSSALPPCAEVSSSECSRDQPAIVFEDQLETEEECVTLCQTYASISVIGCTFAAWDAGVVLGKCTLYKEPFANYLAHCQLLAGPPDVSGCSVDHPAENSCDGIRQGECILQGHVSEITESIGNWTDCANFCKGNPSFCRAWSYRDEPIRRCFLYDSADKDCTTSYTPSGVNPFDCETAEVPGLIITGGKYNLAIQSSIEVFSANDTGCSIPRLPNGIYGHSLSLLEDGSLVICGGYRGDLLGDATGVANCISWKKDGADESWQIFATLSVPYLYHVSYTNTTEKFNPALVSSCLVVEGSIFNMQFLPAVSFPST